MFTQDEINQALFPAKPSMLFEVDVFFKDEIQNIYVQVEADIIYIYTHTFIYMYI